MSEANHAEAIKAAEKRGYARGYEAGKRRKYREHEAHIREAKRLAFAERLFLTFLPVAMQVQGWKVGGEPISSGDQRIGLAVLWTKQAMNKRYEL